MRIEYSQYMCEFILIFKYEKAVGRKKVKTSNINETKLEDIRLVFLYLKREMSKSKKTMSNTQPYERTGKILHVSRQTVSKVLTGEYFTSL